MDLENSTFGYEINNQGIATTTKLEKNNFLLTIYGSYRLLVSVSGSLGNILVILAVMTTRRLRTPANVFVVSLALADMCITAFMEPISGYAILADMELYNRKPSLCTAIASVCYISCTCSLWNIGAIAINRYVFICRNQSYRKMFTWHNSIVYAICIWLICIIADLSNFFGWGGHSFDKKFLGCSYDRLADFSHVLFTVIVFVTMPMVLIMMCYTAVFYALWISSRKVGSIGNSMGTERNQRGPRKDLRLLKMLFTIFLTFSICWTLYTLLIVVDFNDSLPVFVYRLSAVLSHTNSSLNSIIYGVMNKNFRDAYCKILSCGKWKPNKTINDLSMNTLSTNTASYIKEP